MNITLPDFSLVVLIGASGAGKSTFARHHFLPTEVISSDYCRALVADDENDLSATNAAFDLLHYIAGHRLARRRLTVVDATNVQKSSREPLVRLAREYHAMPVAVVLDMPEALCHQRNAARPERAEMKPHVVRRHRRDLRRSLRGLQKEGFRHVHVLRSPEEVAAVTVERQPLWTDRRTEHGPFDIIGDVHGCFDELVALLGELGYAVAPEGSAFDGWGGFRVTPPDGRRAIFLGDYVDRGPDPVGVLKLVMGMQAAGTAICLPGNHDAKLLRALQGRKVQRRHGLAATMEALEAEPEAFRDAVVPFLKGLVSHFMLDDGRLVVAHAGMKEEYAGRASRTVRSFALYGDTTGEVDAFGLPVRLNWAADYRGRAMVVYGHTPVYEPGWLNNTINIDTGCCFGGRLTALRYPEKELVSVPAARVYVESPRPIRPEAGERTLQQVLDDVLDLEDVTGKRIVQTRLQPQIIVDDANSLAALEVMGRFAVDPRWLIYLPPTMSPTATSEQDGYLEYPTEAFDYYRGEGVTHVVCEEKHMGSRAIVVVCRDAEAARTRFGVTNGSAGVVYTRTGRPFFDDATLAGQFLARLQAASTAAGLWEELATDWLLLDAELMPWSAKAQRLLSDQYAAVGAAAEAGLAAARGALAVAVVDDEAVTTLRARTGERAAQVARYRAAYRHYCWPVTGLSDLKLAPFHLLAAHGTTFFDRDHAWHMEKLARLAAADTELLLATPYRVVEVADEAAVAGAVTWWESLTGAGGEGFVVKPLDFIARGPRWLVQPAVKVRGRDYLRIIYGPEYTAPANLARLRRRGLGRKRSLAAREFALGVEALERFSRGEPLRRVHECVFAVLALESEPVDPRL